MNHFREILDLRIPIFWVVAIFCAQLGVAGAMLVSYGVDLNNANTGSVYTPTADTGHTAYKLADR